MKSKRKKQIRKYFRRSESQRVQVHMRCGWANIQTNKNQQVKMDTHKKKYIKTLLLFYETVQNNNKFRSSNIATK